LRLKMNAVAGATLAALLLTACTETAKSTDRDGAMKIGLVNPTSGAVSWAGVPISRGAQTAVKEINSSDFLEGRRLSLTSSDSEGDPSRAISQYRGFVADGFLAVICCSISSEAGSFAKLAESAKMPTVANGATLAGLNNPPYSYRTIVLPAAEGGMYSQVVDAVVSNENPSSAVIVQTADNEGNVSDAKQWTKSLNAKGVDILDTIDIYSADTDFTVPATKINSLNPDLLVLSTQGPTSATIIKLLRERGFKGLATSSYGIAPPSIWKIGGKALAGTLFPIPFTPLSDTDRTSNFVDLYKDDWNEEPDLYSAQGYNAVWFIAEGIKNAGKDVTRESLAESLKSMTEFELVSGTKVKMIEGQATLADEVPIVQWNDDGSQSLWP
jgi:branched-chain amino acid transport system substrate-binding protein